MGSQASSSSRSRTVCETVGTTALPASCCWVTCCSSWVTVAACDLLVKVTGLALKGRQSLQSVMRTLAISGTWPLDVVASAVGAHSSSFHTDAAARAHPPCSDSSMGAPSPLLSVVCSVFFFLTSIVSRRCHQLCVQTCLDATLSLLCSGNCAIWSWIELDVALDPVWPFLPANKSLVFFPLWAFY